jgi:phage tail tape-measure protein
MRSALLAAAAAACLSFSPIAAHADDTGAAAGAVTGAVAGALVGGPVGAVIGAAIGGVVVGTVSGPNAVADARVGQPLPATQERLLVDRRRRGVVADPQSTGSIVEMTCVRDARGNTKCRNEALR